MARTCAKDLHNLLRHIGKLSGGQASICDWDPDDCSTFVLEIAPSGGLYASGKFKFTFQMCTENYPEIVPQIICTTPIYHPNIDTIGDSFEDTNICVSLLDDWTEDNELDDCVQALLFLFYNPNTEDPLCPLICPAITEDEFEDNVRRSLEGGDVEGQPFEANYGFIDNNIVKCGDNNEEKVQEDDENIVETEDLQENSEELIAKHEKEVGDVNDNEGNLENFKEIADVRTDKTSNENANDDKEILTAVNSEPKDRQEKETKHSDQNDYKIKATIELQSRDQVSTSHTRHSNNFTELYHAFDNLVAYDTLISVIFSYFIRRVYKWR
ncbi:UBE2M [Mytilus coruscus]|uniref:UBE2M n=1 Tax=Mytilus coruscus TaxID=42192 RepID=A0A6J8BW51_MYTCO|nr:UBE2M [Mytilus coruscus]